MKRSTILGSILALSAVMPVSISAPAVDNLRVEMRGTTRRSEQQQPVPASQSNATAMTLRQLIGGGVNDGIPGRVILAPMWPHNRPQPGWRKVQSRARHAERMRRQRRNAHA